MHPRRDPLDTKAFAARVMHAISTQRRPTPTRAFIMAIRERSIRDAAAAVWVAWHLATVRRSTVTPSVRVRSFALVFGVVLALGAASLAAAATVHVVAEAAVNGFNAGQHGVDEPGPVQNQTPDGQDGAGGTDNPGHTKVDEPGANQPGANEPGTNQRGVNEPGTNQPGVNQPGVNQPGVNQPGVKQPGVNQPGANQPGVNQPGLNDRAAPHGGSGGQDGGLPGGQGGS